ncbi:MAG: DUF1963 domain-containing protein [Acidaminococcales bacterium]|jgi:uncharacterized protein YwqG|nr:DUF1963 domain-containing protein [Acidaminococcales bacterium]
MPFFKKRKNLFREIKNAAKPYAKPALHLITSGDWTVFSKMGQMPDVPKSFEWPAWNGKPLAFLMQLKFSEINGDGRLPQLPTSGLLYIFYDEEQGAWGFDPKDKGSWRLLFFEETDALKARRYPKDLGTRYKLKYVEARLIDTYPPVGAGPLDAIVDCNEEREEAYYEFRAAVYEEMPGHHLGGYPDPIQDADMDLECQLVSNGLYCGNESGYEDERAEALAKSRGDWTLLLQTDSDNDTEMMWGDGGSLYFWIRKDDLAARNFDDVWMILQCS